MLDRIKALRQAKAGKVAEANALLATMDTETEESQAQEDEKRFDEIEKEIQALDSRISREEKLLDHMRTVEPAANVEAQGRPNPAMEFGEDREAMKPFSNLGEQLRAIYNAADPLKPVDKRLHYLNDRYKATYAGPSGMNEGIDSEGGFALQVDFAGMMFDSAVKAGQILSLVDTYEVGPNSNGAKWVDIDESSIATTVFGGVQVYWAAEADDVTASKPALKAREVLLKKLFGLAYATDELLQDTTFVTQLYTKAFTTAIIRTLEGDIFSGTGVGRPLGILNSDAAVEVAKEGSQQADTLVYENIVKMWHSLHPDYRSTCVWSMHPDCEEQLEYMEFPIGTGGVPIFSPAGAGSAGISQLKGRPIYSTDHCEALGDAGDIHLWVPKEYLLLKKGGIKSESSIHVRFLYGEQTFRFTFRANGEPKKRSALTIKNSSSTRTAYVRLAERA